MCTNELAIILIYVPHGSPFSINRLLKLHSAFCIFKSLKTNTFSTLHILFVWCSFNAYACIVCKYTSWLYCAFSDSIAPTHSISSWFLLVFFTHLISRFLMRLLLYALHKLQHLIVFSKIVYNALANSIRSKTLSTYENDKFLHFFRI